jgi:hypothetical protein
MNRLSVTIHFTIGMLLGSVIACSPTKFNPSIDTAQLCDSSVSKCVILNNSIDITQDYKIGSGKIDILFVNDNSASMSKNQMEMASKFAGFIQNLDSKNIDYRIAIATTDISSVQKDPLVNFSSGRKYLSRNDSDRVSQFSGGIVRNETILCEDFIVSMFNSFGLSFQEKAEYSLNYSNKCPSSDTRGIYAANLVVSKNSNSFIRPDANLNIILISNDNVRQGKNLENSDRASTFVSMMSDLYPNKYWDFNSIVVKDDTCKASQTLRNAFGTEIRNSYGPAIQGSLGIEYANLSNSAARNIENNPRPRGKILSICEANYSKHFNEMATQISDDARLLTLKCAPTVAPIVTLSSNGTSVDHKWSEDKIIFPRGLAGQQVKISYRCYTGPT